MRFTLKVWRQAGPDAPGHFETHEVDDVSPDMSFLELLDLVNDRLTLEGREPIAFESDCREGICGTCGVMINGRAHGPLPATATCQVHLRHLPDGQTLIIEPWRANAFPVIKDLVVDRTAFDRIIAAGGYVSVNTGSAPEANETPVPRDAAENALDAAACIGCAACVAACPNSAAQLFTASKIAHLALLPQGQPERERRVVSMVHQMENEGFGSCTNHAECEAVCPKHISIDFIAMMNRDYRKALFTSRRNSS